MTFSSAVILIDSALPATKWLYGVDLDGSGPLGVFYSQKINNSAKWMSYDMNKAMIEYLFLDLRVNFSFMGSGIICLHSSVLATPLRPWQRAGFSWVFCLGIGC